MAAGAAASPPQLRGSVGSRYALAGSYGAQQQSAAAQPPSLLPQPGGAGGAGPAPWQPQAGAAAQPGSVPPAPAQLPAHAPTAAAAAVAADGPGQPLRISATRRYSLDSQGSGIQPGMQFAPEPAAAPQPPPGAGFAPAGPGWGAPGYAAPPAGYQQQAAGAYAQQPAQQYGQQYGHMTQPAPAPPTMYGQPQAQAYGGGGFDEVQL